MKKIQFTRGQEPFRKYNLDEEEKKQDTFTLWLNDEDRIMLEEGKRLLQQSKDSTAIKTLAHIGAKTIGSNNIAYILEQVYANKRKNKRTNIVDFE